MSEEITASFGANLVSVSSIIVAAILWGTTDAFMKFCSPPQVLKNAGIVSYFLSLLSKPSYLLCLIFNQIGSIVYYFSLATAPLSLVSPVVNTTKLLVNVLVGRTLGEPSFSWRKTIGLVVLFVGIQLQITA